MEVLNQYLREMLRIHATGAATPETSFYPAIAAAFQQAGKKLDPAVHVVLNTRNRGSGIPDGAIFLRRSLSGLEGLDEFDDQSAPERGVVEIKGLDADVEKIATTKQVQKYLNRYGQVLVTNYRDFLQIIRDPEGSWRRGESFRIANSPGEFWGLAQKGKCDQSVCRDFDEFLARVLSANAPLSSPEDLAGYLAAYAKVARRRIDANANLKDLERLQGALEDGLGLRFEGDQGVDFFHSALVQTLFYGVFASWVDWVGRRSSSENRRFSWKTAQWTLSVPMVRVLFQQLVTPQNLPAGLEEILDWTEDVLARVDIENFFDRFAQAEAVSYFYEPFLQAYDPELRKQLGVWYTPPEIVSYMVSRVHSVLKEEFGLPLGLADEQVHVLDPCTGTGSFLLECLKVVRSVLEEEHGADVAALKAKQAALDRLHGFEILPAPFIVTHLQIGLYLADQGAALDANKQERPSVFLTNALSGWTENDQQFLPFDEFASERDAAGSVKRTEPILVVLGNPPYNGFTGVGDLQDDDLLRPYKEGLSKPPWEITKNKLDDYYVRFFRVAERRIAEQTGRGVVCYISNNGWLGDPSCVLMRDHLMKAFDGAFVDNLNGDSRETGKKTPQGNPDPSVFSTRLNPAGIQVGTAISLLVRSNEGGTSGFSARYRDLWGVGKLAQLAEEAEGGPDPAGYIDLGPDDKNWFRLRRWEPKPGYDRWPSVKDLAAVKPDLGLNENRGEGLQDIDRAALKGRMEEFLAPQIKFDELSKASLGGLLQPWAGYDPKDTRSKLLTSSPFSEDRLTQFQVRPFDVRWAYIDETPGIWNRSRPAFVEAAKTGSEFLLVRRMSPRALDGSAFLLSPHLADQHSMHKDAYAIPLVLADTSAEAEIGPEDRLFPVSEQEIAERAWRPNLSEFSIEYLNQLGYSDIDRDRYTAKLIWFHCAAIGFSPEYVLENGDAIRNGWARVPMPKTADLLEDSARLGVRIAALLDIHSSLPGVDVGPKDRVLAIGELVRGPGEVSQAMDLEVREGWGLAQVRVHKSGAKGRVVMPRSGRTVVRERRRSSEDGLSEAQRQALGDEVDVYLNENTVWRGIPEAAWNYKAGGYQVLRKWLSYRDSSVLGRPLTLAEALEFQSIARRLSELVLMGDDLDLNYRIAAGVVSQDPLPEFVA
jgi:hypothetical protein